MTVGFFHGAGAETLLFVTGTTGKVLSPGRKPEKFFTLPPLLKKFVIFFFAWEFCLEKWRGFLVNFLWSRFPNEARKILKKFGENSEQNSGQNSGSKFENSFYDLEVYHFSGSRKRGVEFKGGSRHDWDRHDRWNRQNRQTATVASLCCILKDKQKEVGCSPEPPKPSKPPKTVMKATPLKLNPFFRDPEKWYLKSDTLTAVIVL